MRPLMMDNACAISVSGLLRGSGWRVGLLGRCWPLLRIIRILRLAAAAVCTLGTPTALAGDARPAIAPFSAQQPALGPPTGWSLVTFREIPTHTQYTLVRDGETVVVRAQAIKSAAALVSKVQASLREFPILRWRWKVGNVLAKSDIARKQGDDYPARVYITFAFDPQRASVAERMKQGAARLIYGGELPFASINYVWDTRAAVGTIAPNAYTNRVRMIVLESGPARLGQWVEERRNVYDDYVKAFGSTPPLVSGVAIMTDTDDTGESAIAWYGDITLEPAPR